MPNAESVAGPKEKEIIFASTVVPSWDRNGVGHTGEHLLLKNKSLLFFLPQRSLNYEKGQLVLGEKNETKHVSCWNSKKLVKATLKGSHVSPCR